MIALNAEQVRDATYSAYFAAQVAAWCARDFNQHVLPSAREYDYFHDRAKIVAGEAYRRALGDPA